MRGEIHYIPDSLGNPRWAVHWRVNVAGARTTRARTFWDRRAAEEFVRQLSIEDRQRNRHRDRAIITPRPRTDISENGSTST